MKNAKIDLVTIDEARFIEACRLYSMWLKLFNAIKSQTSRGINMPDIISEQMVCYALNLKWNKGRGGDASDENGALIEIKATSNYDSDLTSFSPQTHFDRLIFFRLNQENDTADIYDLGLTGDTIGNLKANKTQSVSMQQRQGRRPHISLIEYIKENNIQKLCTIDIMAHEII